MASITLVKPRADLITPVSHLTDYAKLIEVAGRTSYKSEDRITAGSAERFIRSIIKRGHESVIEHCSVTYKFTCSRSCSHQLVRHRLAAYTQESMRFCDYSKGDSSECTLKVICPPRIKEAHQEVAYIKHCARAYEYYEFLRGLGVPPEDARFALPIGTKTEVVATFNLRQWRHVFHERLLNPHAQWEIKGLMRDACYELNTYIPIFFEDIVQELLHRKRAAELASKS